MRVKGDAMNNCARTTGISQGCTRNSRTCNYPIASQPNAIPPSSTSSDRALTVLALGQQVKRYQFGMFVAVLAALSSLSFPNSSNRVCWQRCTCLSCSSAGEWKTCVDPFRDIINIKPTLSFWNIRLWLRLRNSKYEWVDGCGELETQPLPGL